MIDYEVLRFIWWLLIGILLIGFAVADGFDMGVGMLTRFLGRNDTERRIMINAIAPHWDGNQVWLITAGGALFAAWPMVYAAAFSGFYVAMILVLASLFFRPVGFDYRSKIEDTRWRNMWDWGIFIGSFVPPLVIGVAFGNLLQGVPFHVDEYLRLFYTGNFFQLLNPFGLLAGIVSVAMILTQGATYLQMRTVGELHLRTRTVSTVAALVTLVCFALAGVWVYYGIDGYVVKSVMDHSGPSNPLTKEVVREAGAWMVNFNNMPALWAVPALGVVLPLLTVVSTKADKGAWAFLFLLADPGLHHSDRRYCDVPVHHAVQHHAERQPDDVGRDLQSADAEPDDLRGDCLRADHSGLHQLVLLEDVWPHYARRHRKEHPLAVLR